ncbi:MAG TPA: hypothetical protein VFO71_07400, partial [Gemmatimonadales bacterium]|nr:hypothetical protein [Gemmatimonadales bacterium]
ARACGAPVVASDLPELREAGGEGEVYVPPTDAGLRSGLRCVIAAPAGPAQSPHLLPTWHESAKVLAGYLNAN